MIESVFKAFDIRGIYPTELDESTARRVGRVFAGLLTEASPGEKLTIVVGRDTRTSSPQIHRAFVDGVISGGVNVDDLDLVPSELIYFSVGKFGYAGGAMITASHNPKEYNGIRMIDRDCKMLSGKATLAWLKSHSRLEPTKVPGAITVKSYLTDYVKHALTFIDVKKIKPLTIVVDAGNGMAGLAITELFKSIPGKLIDLNFELNGDFPNRPPNPLLPESQAETKSRVVSEHADLGVIFDGDADRVMFVTETGQWIRGDIGLLLLARVILAHEQNAGIAYNVVCSKAVPEKIKAWGGRPIRTPVGFINVSGGLRKEHGAVGGESSAHYCFRDNFYADSGLIALVLVLEALSVSGQTFSQFVSGLNPYFREETNLTATDVPKITRLLKQHYSRGRQDELDGLTVEFDDWWFNVRGSNTEPLLRVTVETDRESDLTARLRELTDFVAEASKG